MATWRLRRLYHQEGAFYAFKMKQHADSQEHLKLTETERLGLIADWSNQTLDMFSRQEGRLQRSFYRALHELQRLRKERDSNLASLSQETHSPSVSETEDV